MPSKANGLPPRWQRVGTTRPTYRRDDGYVVKFDNPGSWGVRAPGCNQPFTIRPEAKAAMAFVDHEWPLAEKLAAAAVDPGEHTIA